MLGHFEFIYRLQVLIRLLNPLLKYIRENAHRLQNITQIAVTRFQQGKAPLELLPLQGAAILHIVRIQRTDEREFDFNAACRIEYSILVQDKPMRFFGRPQLCSW